MVDFKEFSEEVFNSLKAYGKDMILYDDYGKRVFEPRDARRIFMTGVNFLVTISEEGDNSALKLYLSNVVSLSQVTTLIDMLRDMAIKSNLLFNVKRYNKQITPADFASPDNINESWFDHDAEVVDTNSSMVDNLANAFKELTDSFTAVLPKEQQMGDLNKWLDTFEFDNIVKASADNNKVNESRKKIKESVEIDSWKEKVKAAYPEHANKMQFKGSVENGEISILAQVPGIDRLFGIFDMDKENGVVLESENNNTGETKMNITDINSLIAEMNKAYMAEEKVDEDLESDLDAEAEEDLDEDDSKEEKLDECGCDDKPMESAEPTVISLDIGRDGQELNIPVALHDAVKTAPDFDTAFQLLIDDPIIFAQLSGLSSGEISYVISKITDNIRDNHKPESVDVTLPIFDSVQEDALTDTVEWNNGQYFVLLDKTDVDLIKNMDSFNSAYAYVLGNEDIINQLDSQIVEPDEFNYTIDLIIADVRAGKLDESIKEDEDHPTTLKHELKNVEDELRSTGAFSSKYASLVNKRDELKDKLSRTRHYGKTNETMEKEMKETIDINQWIHDHAEEYDYRVWFAQASESDDSDFIVALTNEVLDHLEAPFKVKDVVFDDGGIEWVIDEGVSDVALYIPTNMAKDFKDDVSKPYNPNPCAVQNEDDTSTLKYAHEMSNIANKIRQEHGFVGDKHHNDFVDHVLSNVTGEGNRDHANDLADDLENHTMAYSDITGLSDRHIMDIARELRWNAYKHDPKIHDAKYRKDHP